MKHNTRAGMSDLPVAILAILALGLIVPTLVLNQQAAVALQEHKALAAQITHLTETVQKQLNIQLEQFTLPVNLVGFAPAAGENLQEKQVESIRLAAEALRQGNDPAAGKFWSEFVTEAKAFDPDCKLSDTPPATLQEMANAMFPYVERAQTFERMGRTPPASAQKRVEANTAVALKLLTPYDKVDAYIAENVAFVGEAQTKEDEIYTQESGGYDKDIADLTAAFTEKETEHKLFMRTAEKTKKERQGKLEEYKSRDAVSFMRETVVGEILKTSSDGRIAYLKLGSRDRIVPGMRFRVGNRGENGVVTDKARIRVSQVWPELAEVEIVRQTNPRVPVLAGDLLVNPFYHPSRRVVVQVVGKDTGTTKAETVARLKSQGVIVRSKFSPDLDFVVKMADEMEEAEGPDVALAAQLDVPVYYARDRRTDRPVFAPADLISYLED